MTVEQKVYAVLAANAGVTALCPSLRIRVPGDWQNLARPFIVHMPIATTPLRVHGGRARLTMWPFYQVSCIGDTYDQAMQLAAAVRDALDGTHDQATFFWKNTRYISTDRETDGPVVEHIAVEFDVAEAL